MEKRIKGTSDYNYTNIINEFAKSEKAITYDDIILSEEIDIKCDILLKILTKDARFLKLGNLKDVKTLQFISKKLLLKRLINLNLRLDSIGVNNLNYKNFFFNLNPLFSKSLTDSDKKIIIRWLKKNPILCDVGKQIIRFPHANTIKILNKYSNNLPELINIINKKNYHSSQIMTIQSIFIEKFFEEIFYKEKRSIKIITLRLGLLNNKKHTLEEVGNLFGLTRERIRQIEKKLKAKLKNYINIAEYKNKKYLCEDDSDEPIVYLLKCIIITINFLSGSKIILYEESSLMRQLNFLFNLFEIPFKKSNILKVALYDFSESTISRIEEFTINSRSINLENFTIFLTNLDDLNITESDVNKLVELMLKTSLKNLSNLDKVEIALKEIGRPAHYTEIGEKCNELFKDKFYSARAILSYLTREPQFSKDELPWVWTGARGVYALKEQGYKRPELSINDTVTEIIYNNYLLTKRPVPFQKILSEMTKYRDVFKESSLRIVCSFNEDIEQIGKDFYIPVEFSKDKNKELKESSINLDNLDKALEKYDK